MEQKSNINPQILQQMLDSATNAAEKGQSQFFSPPEFARQLATALPKVRPVIVDLNCGTGNLLHGTANDTTELLLGADIDPIALKKPEQDSPSPRPAQAAKRDGERAAVRCKSSKITRDLTLLYPLLKEVDFTADLFVLNPPWRLWWHRDRLKDLANSEVDAVRNAFATLEDTAHRKGTVDGTIDSTIATLMIALDLMSYKGEGFIIGNHATFERLIFTPGAPHAALAAHIWAHVVVPGNPMTGIADCLWEKETEFKTGILYFCRAGNQNTQRYEWNGTGPLSADRCYRMGAQVTWDYRRWQEETVDVWECVKETVREQDGGAQMFPHNLWLSPSGRIRTHLSSFQERSVKVDKKEAERLHSLQGKSPMELVLQRNQRTELLHVAERGGWKVEPALLAAIQQAIADYHSARAPLYPLPDIQRLGYLDEADTIGCKKDLLGLKAPVESDDEDGRARHSVRAAAPPATKSGAQGTARPTLIFAAGSTYSLRTQTVQVTRKSSKFNPLTGEREDLEFSGQELAIYISDGIVDPHDDKQKLDEYCFMDQKILADKNTTVSNTGKRQRYNSNDKIQVDFTLQQLAEHFTIPEVPDVASANPEGYKKNLDTLTELERLTEAMAI